MSRILGTYVDFFNEDVPVLQRVVHLHQGLPQPLVADLLSRNGLPEALDRVDLVDHTPVEILQPRLEQRHLHSRSCPTF